MIMIKKISIMQPTYLPWIGYFDMIDSVDEFVLLDHVQLVKRSWQTRNRILSGSGELFLTIPVKKTNHRDDTFINTSVIDDSQQWRKDHLRNITKAYSQSPFFLDVYTFIYPLIDNSISTVSEFNSNFIINIARRIGINTTFLKSSEIETGGLKKDELLADLCKQLNAKYYLSARGSAIYIERENTGGEFYNQNIQLFYHYYEHPVYDQQNDTFQPFMCILDLLFNNGFNNALEKIRSGRREPVSPYELIEKLHQVHPAPPVEESIENEVPVRKISKYNRRKIS